jgi:hypothetical protein
MPKLGLDLVECPHLLSHVTDDPSSAVRGLRRLLSYSKREVGVLVCCGGRYQDHTDPTVLQI